MNVSIEAEDIDFEAVLAEMESVLGKPDAYSGSLTDSYRCGWSGKDILITLSNMQYRTTDKAADFMRIEIMPDDGDLIVHMFH